MILHTIESWTDFKTEVTNRALCPQWVDENNSYYLYAQDGFLNFQYELQQTDPTNSDQIDFETNYKTIWNTTLEYRDGIGLPRVHTSPRPDGTTTYFTGAGDTGEVGEGASLIFNMTASDVSKSKEITFNEDVHIKDGFIVCEGAPLGSKIDVEILDPANNIVMRFVKSYNLLGSIPIPLNSEDQEKLLSILKLKITVHNSVNGSADHEAPKDFKVVGNIECYRTTTV